jgi:hypothetical protein
MKPGLISPNRIGLPDPLPAFGFVHSIFFEVFLFPVAIPFTFFSHFPDHYRSDRESLGEFSDSRMNVEF